MFVEILEKGGVTKGDILMLHSSYSPIKTFFDGPSAFKKNFLFYKRPK